MILTSVLSAREARGECVKIPIQDFLSEHKDSILLKGTVAPDSSATEIRYPDGFPRFKYTFEVERVWKGSVEQRIDLYVGLSGNDPQIGDRPFLATAMADSVKRRLGITGRAYAAVLCSDVYSESEIIAVLGPGKEPPREAVNDRRARDSSLHRNQN